MKPYLSAMFVLFAFLLLTGFRWQKQTLSVLITGNVKAEQVFTFAKLQALQKHAIGDVPISNHKGDLKGIAKGLHGVLLRDVLQNVILDRDNPKFFSAYYFVCKGADGYTVVYSWNEIFNTATGNSAYIVLEKDGKTMEGSEDNLLMISSKDERTGRRYVKNLETIIVERAG